MAAPAFFHLRRPDRRLGSEHQGGGFSYEAVGSTRTLPPDGWDVDRQVAVVGRGEADFLRARALVRDLRQFDLDWVDLHSSGPAEADKQVVFASYQLGVWSLNFCRVVYMIDDDEGRFARFGFAYGTLESHAVAGEERFLVTWDRQTDEVTFEIYKFSRLRHPLVRMVGPIARSLQLRFSRDAIDRIRRGVQEGE